MARSVCLHRAHTTPFDDPPVASRSFFYTGAPPDSLLSRRMYGIFKTRKARCPNARGRDQRDDRAMSKVPDDMALAVVIPHPMSPQLAKHTYLCASCNQTKTYILPVGRQRTCVAGGDDPARQRQAPMNLITVAGSRGKHSPHPRPSMTRTEASFCLAPSATFQNPAGGWSCSRKRPSRNISCFHCCRTEAAADLCSKVWQLALVVGVRFVERQSA